MPDNITLVRGDGTQLSATPEQAQRLALLGYKPLTEEARDAELASQAKSEYYESAGQKAITGLEGFGSGLTFGATDYVGGALGSDVKERAYANPGTRLGSELLGALAPLALSGGATAEATAGEIAGSAARFAARKAPTALLSEAARALAPGAEGSLTKAVLKGAIEGTAYGGAGAADHAYLDGEPITGEAVLHGMGWGALVGGGLSAAGHGLGAVGERLGKAAEPAVPKIEPGTLKLSAGNEYGAFRSEISNLSDSIKGATRVADDAFEQSIQALRKGGGGLRAVPKGQFESDLMSVEKLYEKASTAAKAGNFKLASSVSESFAEKMAEVAAKNGVVVPDTSKALQELIAMKSVHRELSSLPLRVEGFAGLSPAKLERTLAAMERAQKMSFVGLDAVNDSASNFSKALGIEGQDLRSTWRAAKDIYDKELVPSVAAESASDKPSFLRMAAGYVVGGKAYVAARAAGFGRMGSYAAFRGVKDAITDGGQRLAGIRAAVLGNIQKAASEYLPVAGSAIKAGSGPASFALATTLYGEHDDSTTDPTKLALARIKEINDLGPTAADTIFRAVEPLSAMQPALAKSIHAGALTSFQAIQELAPKDPGVISKLKSIWQPSGVQVQTLAKQMQVFHDPVGTAVEMLQSGRFDIIKSQALQKVAPAIWQELRVRLLERITQPDVISKMSYRDQIGLSAMLGIDLHTSMTPGYIAMSQQIFLDRSQPLPTNPRMGQAGGMPQPSDNVNQTASQRNASH